MNIMIKLDEIGKIGTVTLDGPIGESQYRVLSTLIDQFVYGLALNGWTLLSGSRTRAPAIIDRESVLVAMAQRAMREQAETEVDIPSADAPAPQAPPSNPDASPEEKRTENFRKWVGDTRPASDPGESDPPEAPEPPKDPA